MPADVNVSLVQKLIDRVPMLQGIGASGYLLASESLPELADASKLDLFEAVLDSVDQKYTSLNPQVPTTKGVEKNEGINTSATLEAQGLTYIEQEPQPELPVEVEGFLKRAEETADKLNQEIVLADANLVTQNQSHPSQPVIILPIDETAEKEARGKSPKFSIVWLVEWSRKIIKQFLGKVIYKT